MENKKNQHTQDLYDDGNIPQIDLPADSTGRHAGIKGQIVTPGKNTHTNYETVEPLPESTRPRQDGPGGSE